MRIWPRSLALVLVVSAPGVVLADGYKVGGAGSYQRPAMAARRHFGSDTQVKARTIGISRDGTKALVVAEATNRKTAAKNVWEITVDRKSGEILSALSGMLGDATFRAGASEANRRDDDRGWVTVVGRDVTGRGLGVITRSGKHIRVGVPGSGDTPTRNVLYPSRTSFLGEGETLRHGHSGGVIVEDPADGVAVKNVPDQSPWFLPHRPGKPNPRPAAGKEL